MEFYPRELNGIVEIQLGAHVDRRGSFSRVYDRDAFEKAGIPVNWVQENQSVNVLKGVVRGLHFLLPPHTDGKLIRCIQGSIFDVVVDLRQNSATRGQWMSFLLHENDHKLIYIPKGFAHGFCTLSDRSVLLYKHDSPYVKAADCGIVWNDPDLAITWPEKEPVLSEKDSMLMTYREFIKTHSGL